MGAHVTSAIDQSAAVGDFIAQESMGCPLTDSGCETKEGKADVEFTCETPFDEHCQCLKMGKTNQLKYLVKERATVCTGADWADMNTRRSMKDGARYAEFALEWKARKLHEPMERLNAQKKMFKMVDGIGGKQPYYTNTACYKDEADAKIGWYFLIHAVGGKGGSDIPVGHEALSKPFLTKNWHYSLWQQEIYQDILLSSSMISAKNMGSWTSVGVIFKTPPENVIGLSTVDISLSNSAIRTFANFYNHMDDVKNRKFSKFVKEAPSISEVTWTDFDKLTMKLPDITYNEIPVLGTYYDQTDSSTKVVEVAGYFINMLPLKLSNPDTEFDFAEGLPDELPVKNEAYELLMKMYKDQDFVGKGLPIVVIDCPTERLDSLRKELDESQDVFVLKNAWIDHLKSRMGNIRRKERQSSLNECARITQEKLEKKVSGYKDIFKKWSRCQAWEKCEKVGGADDHEAFKTLFAKHQKANKAMVLKAPYLANLFGADGRLKDIEAWKAKAISTSEPYFMDDWLDTAFVKRVANNPFSDLNSETCIKAKRKYDLAQQQIQLVAEENQAKKDTRRENRMRARREMKKQMKKKKATKSGATTK